jgi:hypothetical protein
VRPRIRAAAKAPRIITSDGVTPHHPVQHRRRENQQSGGNPGGRRRSRRRRNAAQPGVGGAGSSASRRQRRGESGTPTEVRDHGRRGVERRTASGTPPAASARRGDQAPASGERRAAPQPWPKTVEGARANGERRAAPQPWPEAVEGAQPGAPRVSRAKYDVTRSPDMVHRTVVRRMGAQRRSSVAA